MNDFAAPAIYGVVRHPQYTGIFLALFGQLIHWPTILTLVLFPFIVWVYIRLARREEAELVEVYGDEYRLYQRRVPMFFPRCGHWHELMAPGSFSRREAA